MAKQGARPDKGDKRADNADKRDRIGVLSEGRDGPSVVRCAALGPGLSLRRLSPRNKEHTNTLLMQMMPLSLRLGFLHPKNGFYKK